MPILYAKSIHVKTKEGEREREIDNLYWQDSAEERLYINILISIPPVSGCSHFKAAWVDMFEISPALKNSAQLQFPRLWLLEGSSDGFQHVWIYNLCIMVL